MRPPGIAALAALALSACAGSPFQPPANATASGAGWQHFPVDQDPRRIVLIGGQEALQPTVEVHAPGPCDQVVRRYAPVTTPLPADAPSLASATWPDGTRATFAAISAADAYSTLTAPPQGDLKPGCVSEVISVTGVRLTTAPFATDRGTAQITAWVFTVSGTPKGQEVAYPAVRPSAIWPGKTSYHETAILAADGRTLSFNFVGSPPGRQRCQAEYKGAVTESSTTAMVRVTAIPGTQGTGTGCTEVGYQRTVIVKLAAALGHRVVLDQSGAATMVCLARVVNSFGRC